MERCVVSSRLCRAASCASRGFLVVFFVSSSFHHSSMYSLNVMPDVLVLCSPEGAKVLASIAATTRANTSRAAPSSCGSTVWPHHPRQVHRETLIPAVPRAGARRGARAGRASVAVAVGQPKTDKVLQSPKADSPVQTLARRYGDKVAERVIKSAEARGWKRTDQMYAFGKPRPTRSQSPPPNHPRLRVRRWRGLDQGMGVGGRRRPEHGRRHVAILRIEYRQALPLVIVDTLAGDWHHQHRKRADYQGGIHDVGQETSGDGGHRSGHGEHRVYVSWGSADRKCGTVECSPPPTGHDLSASAAVLMWRLRSQLWTRWRHYAVSGLGLHEGGLPSRQSGVGAMRQPTTFAVVHYIGSNVTLQDYDNGL